MNSKNYREDFEIPLLASHLREFYGAVSQDSSETYWKSGMINLRSGINQHLTMPPYNRIINMMRNEAFMIANRTFSGRLRKIKESGKCVKNTSKDTSAPNDVEKVYKDYFIPYYKTNPRVLQHKVYFELCYYMGRHGNENLRVLTKDSFIVKSNENGK